MMFEGGKIAMYKYISDFQSVPGILNKKTAIVAKILKGIVQFDPVFVIELFFYFGQKRLEKLNKLLYIKSLLLK